MRSPILFPSSFAFSAFRCALPHCIDSPRRIRGMLQGLKTSAAHRKPHQHTEVQVYTVHLHLLPGRWNAAGIYLDEPPNSSRTYPSTK